MHIAESYAIEKDIRGRNAEKPPCSAMTKLTAAREITPTSGCIRKWNDTERSPLAEMEAAGGDGIAAEIYVGCLGISSRTGVEEASRPFRCTVRAADRLLRLIRGLRGGDNFNANSKVASWALKQKSSSSWASKSSSIRRSNSKSRSCFDITHPYKTEN
jgi:hypothetical protein